MKLPKRKPTRLKEYDYSNTGVYFITTCTKDRKRLLSEISVGFGIYDKPQINLSQYGAIVEKYIRKISLEHDDISVDHFVIMPNHIHMLVSVQNNIGASQVPHPTNETIPKFVSLFKRYCNREVGWKIWQKSYFDHIIRNERDYYEHYKYIENNPAEWEADELY